MSVLSVVGNRPQFVKSAPLSVALRARGIEEVVVHTGQHYDRGLSQVFFEELDLAEPAHALGLRTSDVEAMKPRVGEIVRAEHVRPFDWKVGTAVECEWKRKGAYFAGKIAAVKGQTGVHIAYADGDREDTDIALCRSR